MSGTCNKEEQTDIIFKKESTETGLFQRRLLGDFAAAGSAFRGNKFCSNRKNKSKFLTHTVRFDERLSERYRSKNGSKFTSWEKFEVLMQ